MMSDAASNRRKLSLRQTFCQLGRNNSVSFDRDLCVMVKVPGRAIITNKMEIVADARVVIKPR